MNVTRFLVTSHGMTASHWFANCLNTHPNIYCSHDSSDVSNGKEKPDINNDEQYKRKLPIRQLFIDSIKYSENESIIGNVAGFILDGLYKKIACEKYDISGLTIANMIRHPITYINSFIALALEFKSTNPVIYDRRYGKAVISLRLVAKQFNVPNFDRWNPETLAFVQACNYCKNIAQDLLYKDVLQLRMELLTRDMEYFNNAVSHLTKGKASFNENDLIGIFQQPISSHKAFIKNRNIPNRTVSYETEPEIIFDDWASWKKNMVIAFFKNTEVESSGKSIGDIFSDQGYDVLFLK